jgi:tetratricopeptide (TPR) repeat protein
MTSMFGPLLGKEASASPEFRQARSELMTIVQRHFENMAAEAQDHPDLRLDIASAFHHLALCYASCGEHQRAIDSYEVSLRTLQGLEQHFPADPRVISTFGGNYYNCAHHLLILGRTEQAIDYFQRANASHERYIQACGNLQSYNNTAWFMSVCPLQEGRNPHLAVLYARKALEMPADGTVWMSPEKGGTWNTLAIALYRAGDYPAALDAFAKSMRMHPAGGEGTHFFFLAMLFADWGEPDMAAWWFWTGISWMEKSGPHPVELENIVNEAASRVERVCK